MMGRIMIVPGGAGFYPDHDATKEILDLFEGFTVVNVTLHGAKAACATKKGGSLHTAGARTQGHVARKLVGYKDVVHEYHQTQREGEWTQHPLELEIEMWCSVAGTQKGSSSEPYCMWTICVPCSPPPNLNDDDIESEDDDEYVDRTPDHEMP
ncbi:hypothetical protein RND71_036954 [Anisodus tanguticus]|uniref:Uncharacterized protein n=1 Tax=Anisodus tanguticus TaxID=243964 RepID=A0AAE1R253_9SOLA|nr:hypothetical protein RND71_036954 [Anisodus tanguticus]